MPRAIEIHVCFKNTWKNAMITVATETVAEARRIARLWRAHTGAEPVTRTIVKQEVPYPDRETQLVDGVTIWPPLF
jgi:hypothetical protein